MKRGIIQSRGLGDILIALPIAKYYADQGDEIVWPVCQEFLPSLVESAPWVQWRGVPADSRGEFFLDAPLRVFAAEGIEVKDTLYLYHYLNTQPQMTSPELFNILKFDQYKYAVAGVPFRLKWSLGECVTRDPDREREFKRSLNLPERYNLAHLQGSSWSVDSSAVRSMLDPAVALVEITEQSNSIFDWLSVIEGAENCVCIDSVFANLIDQLNLQGPRLYWIRRSPWDLTPVLGSSWRVVPTNLPIKEPVRVDPAVEAAKLQASLASQGRPQPQNRAAQASQGGGNSVQSHVPFQTDRSKIPTSFMHALKK
jgi:hypothetical protein